jgi:tetratricopeptide (TPR) repeat protein
MIETTPEKPKRFSLRWLIPVGLLILLGGLYVGGKYVLMPQVTTGYQSKDCAAVERYAGVLSSLYPGAVESSPELTNAVNECSAYALAVQQEQAQQWESAHNAYQAYAQEYPSGVFTGEAREHDALALSKWAQAQLAAKQYEAALKNLALIQSDYKNTPAAQEAAVLMPQAIVAWGTDLRASGDFAAAETKFKELDTWARSNVSQEYVDVSKRELVQTYLEWGLALKAKQDFSKAISLFNHVIETDSNPQAENSPAQQAGTAIRESHLAWGDMLAAQENFSGALEQYQTYISLTDVADQAAAKDILAGTYLKWSDSVRKAEDFIDALNKIKLAEENAGTDEMKATIASGQTATYKSFSESSGKQAVAAIGDHVKSICEKRKKEALPIFGLDPDVKLTVLFGVSYTLPEEITAKTPGELHYITCVEPQMEIVQAGYLFWILFAREKYNWKVTLTDAISGEALATTLLEGAEPPPFPVITYNNYMDYLNSGGYNQRYRGDDPDIVTLVNWLKTVMK